MYSKKMLDITKKYWTSVVSVYFDGTSIHPGSIRGV